MQTRIYSYAAKAPITGLESVNDQMFLAHKYRNVLVGIEQARRAAVDALLLRYYPELAAIEKQLLEIKAQYDRIEMERDAERARVRSKKRLPQDEALKALGVQRRPLNAQRKILRASAFASPKGVYSNTPCPVEAIAGPEMRYVTTGLSLSIWRTDKHGKVRPRKMFVCGKKNEGGGMLCETRTFATVHAMECYCGRSLADAAAGVARKLARSQSNLLAGNYLIVEQEPIGRGTPPVFHAFRGNGHLAVQISNGTGVDEPHRLLRLAKTGEPRKYAATMRVDDNEKGDPVYAAVPFSKRRSMPQDARIMWGHLIRKQVGYSTKWKMQFTLRGDATTFAKKQLATTGACGIDIGWRVVPGGLRVGYWVGSDGDEGEILIPTQRVDSMKYADSLQSIRDGQFDAAIAALNEWRQHHPVPAWFTEAITTFDRDAHGQVILQDGVKVGKITLPLWKSKQRLRKVVRLWRDNRFDGDDVAGQFPVLETYARTARHHAIPGRGAFSQLWAWDKQEAHLFNVESFTRLRYRNWRLDMFRQLANTLRRCYATLVVEKMDIRELCRKDKQAHDVASRNRTLAACGELREVIVNCGATEIVKYPARNTTLECYKCGFVDKDRVDREVLVQTCPGCGETEDQDVNAAHVLLQHRQLDASVVV